MLKLLKYSLSGCLLVLCSLGAAAQEDAAAGNVQASVAETAQAQTRDQEDNVKDNSLHPGMSPASEAPVEYALESTAMELVNQAPFTAMGPGSCLVVDELVKEFCNANPDDISCQFQ